MSNSAADDPLREAIIQAGIPARARLLLAVSGGADSVALLEGVLALANEPEWVWAVRVGHVNHCLRGAESDADEEFVRRLAAERRVEVDVARVDTAEYAKQKRKSLETAARELRWAALEDMLRAWGGDLLATGHTQDDQAETVLLRLLRGSGSHGLGAMHRRSGPIVRPLLSVRHETIVRVLEERGQDYRVDSSNFDLAYHRNRVRWEVLPTLARLQPRVVEILGRTASLLQRDADYMLRDSEAAIELLGVAYEADAITFSRAAWRGLHPALRGHALRLLVQRLLGHTHDLDEGHLAALYQATEREAQTGRTFSQLPHGLSMQLEGDRLSLLRGQRPAHGPMKAVQVGVPGEVEREVGVLLASVSPAPPAEELERLLTVCGPLHALCDADLLGTGLVVRGRQPGDRMRPLGAPGSRKLQDILVDRHVPEARRDRLPIVQNERHIVWIPGVALDQRVAVTEQTRRLAHLRFLPR